MNTNCASLNGRIPIFGCVSLTDSRSMTGCIALYTAHGLRLTDRCVHLSRIDGRRPDEMYYPGFRAGPGARLWWKGSPGSPKKVPRLPPKRPSYYLYICNL